MQVIELPKRLQNHRVLANCIKPIRMSSNKSGNKSLRNEAKLNLNNRSVTEIIS